jgi:endonuclease YncB( thermonuclease family)
MDQLRQYVEAGQLAPQDHAFYEGAAGWMPLAEVPGFAKEKSPTEEKPARSRKKLAWMVGGGVALVTVLATGGVLLWGDEEEPAPKSTAESHPETFVIKASDVVSVYDGDTFKIDLQGVHPIFGDNVSVRVNGIDTPEITGETDEVEALARKARDFVKAKLEGAAKIELRNPQRGKYFRILADVYLDGASLAQILKDEGLAKAYDGKGAKPTW